MSTRDEIFLKKYVLFLSTLFKNYIAKDSPQEQVRVALGFMK